jgi:ribosome-binding ATPase YchF (GTP1/OBG family)
MAITARDIRSPGSIHHSRWQRIKNGMTLEEVAAQDGVSITTTRNSFLLVEDYKNLCSMPSLETAQIENIIKVKELELEALKSGLIATNKVYKDVTVDGKTVQELIEVVPDHETRIATISTINQKIAALQPKKGFSVNVDTKVGVNVATGRTSFEDKLREILQKRKQEEPSERVIDVPALEEGENDKGDVDDAEISA